MLLPSYSLILCLQFSFLPLINNCDMEISEDVEIKCFDDTAAFIYSSISSTPPPGLPKEPFEVDSKTWFVKTEPASPVRDPMDKDQNPAGVQFEIEPSLQILIKREVTSPAREHVEESSISPPGLYNELCEVDSKAWFVKTETTLPVRDPGRVEQDQGLQMDCEPSWKMFVKTEVTSPAKDSQHEEESAPGPANNEATESDLSLQNSYCPHTTRLQSDMQIHDHSLQMKLNADEGPHCNYKSTQKSSLKLHFDSVEENISAFQCPYCEYKTTSRVNTTPMGCLKRCIVDVHTSIKAFQCPLCEHKTNWKSALKKHIDSVHKNITASQYKTTSKDCLKRYYIVDVHKSIKAFQCPLCEHKTNWKCALKKHIDSVHKKIKAFQCTHCKYKCSMQGNLNKHIDSVHKNIRAFQCTYCQYKTNFKNSLKIHIDLVHKNIRAFQCPYCEYKTNWKGTLKRHIDSVHKNIRAFQCTYCKYKSSQKTHLKNHIDSLHSVLTTFQCPYCQYKSKWKNSLKRHIASVHNKIKAFQCAYCEHKCSRKSTLKRHIDLKHKKKGILIIPL